MSVFFTSASDPGREQLVASLAYLVLQLAVFNFFSCPFACRRILAPGEEENLEFEEDEEEGGAGAGSPDSFPARVPGGYPLSANVRCVAWSRLGCWGCVLVLASGRLILSRALPV